MAKKSSSQTPKGSKSQDNIDRKQKIISAAVDVFLKNGAAFTRLAEVAKAAKVPAPLIHYYYKDIEDLHFDIVMVALESLKHYSLRYADETDMYRFMKEYIKGPILWASEQPQYMSAWMYFYYMCTISKRFSDLNTLIREGGRDRISMMIYRGIEQGVFNIDGSLSVKELAQEVQAIISGQAITFATEKKHTQIDYFVEQATVRVMELLHCTRTS